MEVKKIFSKQFQKWKLFSETFLGVLGETTENRIGITETIITSAFAGIVYSLFAGCPLIILGVTGPSLLFDQALWAFSQSKYVIITQTL